MTEQNPNPDLTDDTEGHGGRGYPGAEHNTAGVDDVEGHTRRPAMDISDEDDDTEGHSRYRSRRDQAPDEDDVEGHARKPRLDTGDEDDDTEGHFRKPR
jgi:hypothetical protein